jgi:hypothetical protein
MMKVLRRQPRWSLVSLGAVKRGTWRLFSTEVPRLPRYRYQKITKLISIHLSSNVICLT